MQATLTGARCPRCNRKDADLERYDDIKQAPEILFICIARYKVEEVRWKNRKGSFLTGAKDLDVVEIPDDLELSDFLNRHDYEKNPLSNTAFVEWSRILDNPPLRATTIHSYGEAVRKSNGIESTTIALRPAISKISTIRKLMN